ncbi:reverse transcriptase domain-containing protein [Tanacetum coccineum]|uniref:Reverse transcriptase domain-containing protein n=1 Tax=Tanacetum coccineum TaxID=301880 RepID=A0ABQ5C8Q0_9ASTR
MENNPRDDYVQQLPYKRHNIARAYTARSEEKKKYAGTLHLCNKCKYHYTGPCTAKCGNCKRIGHQTKDCRSLVVATNQRDPVTNQRTLTCFESRGRVYALGGGETEQDLATLQMISMLKERFFSSCLVKPKLESY